MQLIISHKSALWFWRTFGGDIARLKRVRKPAAMSQPPDLTPQVLEELARFGFFPHATRPLHLLFAKAAARTRTDALVAHCTEQSLPSGSLVQLSEHLLIASPELTFVQEARRSTPGHLILVGCELTGTYVRRPAGEPLGERPPLTTAAKLQEFALQMHPQGTSAAIRAARRVLDRAASPMEAKLALLLSLPSAMGGFGLPAPTLNREFTLSADAQRIYPCTSCRLDLSWPGCNLDVEYDGSGDEHTGEMHAKDVARLAALRLDGLDVMVLAKQQVYDPTVFAQMAQVIAGKLTGHPGRAWRIRAKDFAAKQANLREELELV